MSPLQLGNGAAPDIFVEENGALHVAWKDGNNLRYRYHTGSSWQPVETLPVNGSGPSAKSPPSVWADSEGNPHIVWATDQSHIFYLRKTDLSWGSKRAIINNNNPSAYQLRDTHIAVSSDGVRHVVWRKKNFSSGKGTIYHMKYEGGSWGSPTQISNSALTAKRPHIALDGNDDLHVVWRGRGGPGNSYEAFYRLWSNGSWGSIEMATYTGPSCAEDAHIAIDNSNVPHISWPEDKQNPQVGYMKRSGGSWSSPSYLGHGEDPVIAIDDSSTRYVIWEDEYRYNDGSGWAEKQVFDEGASSPDAYGGGQYAHVVYRKNYRVWYVALSVGGEPPPPTRWITITSPNGGEVWEPDSDNTLVWESSTGIDSVKISYSTDSGSSWMTVVDNIPNTGSCSWIVPNTPSDNCRMRIEDTTENGIYDFSDTDFSIGTGGDPPPPDNWITVTTPDGGEVWEPGSSHTITWDSSGNFTHVRLDYSTNGGQTWVKIASKTGNDGTRDWTIPGTLSDQCRVRIQNKEDSGTQDISDADFCIGTGGGEEEWITVTVPNGGESWEPDSIRTITWDTSTGVDSVALSYSTDSGSSWIPVTSVIENTGSFNWTIPDTPSDNCVVKVADTNGSGVNDISDVDFTISRGGGGEQEWITVTAPNGGESWEPDSSYTITWSSSTGVDSVKTFYSTTSGSSWIAIAGSFDNTGSSSWVVPDTPSNNCRVRIEAASDDGVYDTSDTDFTIGAGGDPPPPEYWVTVTSPNGDEVWEPGSSHPITWDSSGNFTHVRLDYSTNGGSSWIKVASKTGNDGARNWTIPSTVSSQCRVRVQSKDNPGIQDVSNDDFRIGTGGGGGEEWITVNSPNGGENWEPDSTRTMLWESGSSVDSVKISYSTDSGSSWIVFAGSTKNTGSLGWVIPATPSDDCRVKVEAVSDASVMDISDADFRIGTGGDPPPPEHWITVTSPNGGEVWEVNSHHTITWNSSGDFNFVRIDYSTDGGGTWIKIASKTGNDGGRDWTVPYNVSDRCRVRVLSKEFPGTLDTSDADFFIGPGGTLQNLELSSSAVPVVFSLLQNYPNPFNPNTQIRFDIPDGEGSSTGVSVFVYDSRGRLVRKLIEEELPPGSYRTHWDGRSDIGVPASSGVYILHIRAGSDAASKKMVLTR